MLLGCIADDSTGATDLAAVLVQEGMRTVQTIGVPAPGTDPGEVDALVNIAGIIHRFVPFLELTPEEAHRVLNVNFWGTVNTSRAFLPHLMERPSAALVNMSSLAALVPFAGQTFYGASKGAVKQFSEGLYAELQDTNVAVSTIFPGNISTNLTGNSGVAMIDAGDRKVRATTPTDAGQQIVDGIARMLSRLARIAAGATTRFVANQMKSVMSFGPKKADA